MIEIYIGNNLSYLSFPYDEKLGTETLNTIRVVNFFLSLSLSCLYRDNGDTQDPEDRTPCSSTGFTLTLLTPTNVLYLTLKRVGSRNP